ncbi:urea ABC transporter permease subunit UrtB [Methylovulum psychrotolerans]|uniref:Urea ABC transporter permease subunit UrtB n=1 Tax=Methylovulum psychrotolerans TaxID=1704499 RepID=A0A2S5CT01_9GAMM|nr:urea ABC transporter permease subunit UrtB [Methylovulum psychrotolerans]MBT9098196.1 urea ABC transporter permease subunit UrtB [Methylovulum psychrotolerans]POZ53908.1 urea ABC transporter permease subunit UrtB [Methylovulum psychrotolerans]
MNIPPLTRFHHVLAVLMLVFSLAAHSDPITASQPWLDALNSLKQGSMPEREQAIMQLAEIKDAHNLAILQALLDGRLFTTKTDTKLVIGIDNHQGFDISDAVSGAALGAVDHDALSKINLTNKMRGTLRKIIGELELSADDPAVRLAAVKAMAKEADDRVLDLLRGRADKEADPAVKEAIKVTLLLQDMDSPDKATRIMAIEALKAKNSQEVVNRLNAMVEKDESGEFVEPDEDIRNLAKAALININNRLQLYSSVETVFFGLSLGAVLVLSAIGLAITFGVMGVINMAHGELMMLGAYTTYVMQQLMPNHLGISVLLAIPAAFVISALVGIAIERGIIRFLYGRPLETLLATFGVSLILQQSVRSIFSPLNRSVATPEWMSGSWQINDFLSLTWNRFYILVFCLLVFVLLLQILKRTRLGLEVRAVAQNRKMAKAMGIPTARVDAMTFGLGSGIAGVAGVALSQITNVGPNLGQAYIVDSFMVVVFGGVGNLLGTLVAGFSLGIANKFLEPFAGAVLAKILVLVFIILFIQKRPRGLFPQKGRAADS